jgi:methylamine dehydrogenase accessory protein MauD
MSASLQVILVLQWALLIGLAVIVLALVRQVGILHQRVAPAGALTMSQGVRPGDAASPLALETLDGDPITIGGAAVDGRSTLLMFVAPDCPVCAQLVPAMRAIAEQERTWLRVVFASDGASAQHDEFRRRKGLAGFPYVVSMELGLTYQVGKLPFGVLLDESGRLVAQGLTNTREHVESLFEAKRLSVSSIQEYIERRANAEARVRTS